MGAGPAAFGGFPTRPDASTLPPSGPAGGDLSGTYPNPTVAKIQGRSVSASAPSTGDVLAWNGTTWVPTSFGVAPETAGAATAAALPVMTNGSSRIVAAGTTFEDIVALRGISTTAAAANGDPISVAGNGAKTGAIFVGLTIREAQYAAGGAVVAESGLAAYIAGAASGSWYRRLGHAISATQILEDWGEPQQVP